MQCLFIFCYSKRQRAKTTPQICFHVFLLVVRWFVLNANPFALAPTHQSNWIRYHMDSCCELWCARTQHKEKSPRKAKTKKHKNVQRMHLLDGQKICTVQIACVISMSRYFATIKNRCHLPSRRLVHILISLHYRLLHLILLVSLSFFAVCIRCFCFKGFLNWKHNWSAFTWTFPSSKCHKINHKCINAA